MKKILILANNDVGLYKFRKELIEELLKENDVFISLPNGKSIGKLTDLGCKFIETKIDRRGTNPFSDLKLLLKYNKIIKKLEPNLVITYTVKPNIYGGLISRLRKIDHVVNITGLGSSFQRDNLIKKIIINMYKTAIKKSQIVFFENRENQENFINNKIISREKTHLLDGAGVNLSEYSYTDYPKSDKKIIFLYIGRVMREKGIDELIHVANRIKGKYTNVVFNIVGPEEDEYNQILMQLQGQKKINYFGYQEDVKKYIAQSHCLILPSYHEGMSNTLLEAGAMGRPLITSDISGCKEAVIEGENGYLAEVKNSEELYRSVCKFIELTHSEKEKMGVYSRKHIETHFDKINVVSETIQAIEHLI